MTTQNFPQSFPALIARGSRDTLAALFVEGAQEILIYEKQDLTSALKLARHLASPDARAAATYLEGSLIILASHERDLASGRTTPSDYPTLEKILPFAAPMAPR